MLKPHQITNCYNHAKSLILKCGEVLKEGYKDCGKVMSKSTEWDLVTVYDQKIEKILIDGILEKFPDHK
jgi:myo-inositol-1(or 4)-monophosphatase